MTLPEIQPSRPEFNSFFEERLAQILIYAKDYNLIGDGIADDSVNIQKMFDDAQGKILVLEKDKIYGFPNEKTLYIKDKTTIFSNGASFKKITTGSNYSLIVSGTKVFIDYLSYIPFTSTSECGVKITGSKVNIETFESVSSFPNCGGDSTSRNALFIYSADLPTAPIKNIHIGKVIAKNWERVVQIRNVDDVQIDYFDIDTFRTAVYLRDCLNVRSFGANIRGLSSTADGNPGQNGVLIEAYTDYATRFITLENWNVQDTGEHGYRIGGQKIVADVTFKDCIARNTGNGKVGDGGPTENGIGHGGCGFKVLGPTSSVSRHRNIHYKDCVAENGRTDVPVDRVNFAGFQIGKCINVIIDNPIVRTNGVSTSDRSFVNGIEIIGCEDVTISNPNIGYTLNNGIHFYDADQSTGDFGTLQSRININGGLILNPVNAGIYLSANNITFRRIRINGTIIDSGGALYAIQGVVSGTGSFTGCSALAYVNPNTGVTTIIGLDNWLVDLTGVFTATANNAANGSTFRDSTGSFKVRKAGAWVVM